MNVVQTGTANTESAAAPHSGVKLTAQILYDLNIRIVDLVEKVSLIKQTLTALL